MVVCIWSPLVSVITEVPVSGKSFSVCIDADAIKDILSRLPRGESVSWCDELYIGQLTETHIDLQLPPEQIVDTIREHADLCYLDFTVTVRSY